MFEITTLVLGALVVLVAYFYLQTPFGPDVHPMVLYHQSDVNRVRRPGETTVYHSKLIPSYTYRTSGTTSTPTVWESVLAFWEADTLPDKVFLHLRVSPATGKITPKFTNINFVDFRTRWRALVRGLGAFWTSDSSTESISNRRVAILLPNCAEWILSYYAVQRLGGIPVPLFTQWNQDLLETILAVADVDTVILPEAVPLSTVRAIRASSKVRTVVVAVTDGWGSNVAEHDSLLTSLPDPSGGTRTETKTLASATALFNVPDYTWATLESLESRGKDEENEISLGPLPQADDVAHILFGSDDDDELRGVKVTHAQVMEGAAAVRGTFSNRDQLCSKDRYLAVSSLADPATLTLFHAATLVGASTVLGTYHTMVDICNDAFLSRPTLMRLPTTLFNGLHVALSDHIKGLATAERYLCRKSLDQKMNLLRAGKLVRGSFWDFLYFRHFRQSLGGQMRAIFTDGQCATRGAAEFIRASMASQVFLTSGQFCCGRLTTCTLMYDYNEPFGPHVGAPLPGHDIKLVDSPTTNSLTSDRPNPRGEIHVKGPLVYQEVYPVPSSAPVTEDWYATGVVAEWLPNCTLRVLGSSLSYPLLGQHGMHVSLPSLENMYRSSDYVEQLCLLTPSKMDSKSQLKAVVYPHHACVLAWAQQSNTTYSPTSVKDNTAVADMIMRELRQVAKQYHLRDQLVPGTVQLVNHPFSVENGMLKPDLTLHRTRINSEYQ
ncbi:medium-chain fatty acid-CoA ligase faa2 [Dispira parvispora]|uniref:Medium-chain fatty acid-CoA ligase faa2 n=1 Tax=Dispira parvispora TaxID=1520584 RepID=A0A9W8B0W7_9FUNG|nr:medium-chain fatty acid-CoA ligase faa2 [Dispira parvispora]